MENPDIIFLKDNSNHLTNKMKKYAEVVGNLIQLSDMNLHEKSLLAPTIHLNILSCYYSENALIKKLEDVISIKKKEYLEVYGKQGIPRFKIDSEVNSNETIVKLQEKLDEQYVVVKFLRDCVDLLKNYNFAVKNCVDLNKLEQ
jgi:hypothetical protein